MIKREKDYLEKKKRKYLRGTLVWLIIMFAVFFTGYILNKSRNNVFTVVAALLVLPVAQYGTQLLAIWKFKDPQRNISEKLESIKGNYNLFHGVLVPNQKHILYIDHIIVTEEKVYCMISEQANMNYIKETMDKKIKAKGIPLKSVEYMGLNKTFNMEKLAKKIEKTLLVQNKGNLEEYTQLIAQMMM